MATAPFGADYPVNTVRLSMKTFDETLKTLPPIDDIAALILYHDQSADDGEIIENRPGKAGSVAVYHALLQEFGTLTPAAARRGLELYAEHVADARANPGKHPNIDRLFRIIEQASEMRMAIRKKQRENPDARDPAPA